jgi:hypothetical protein
VTEYFLHVSVSVWIIHKLSVWIIHKLSVWIIHKLSVWIIHKLSVWIIHKLSVWIIYRLSVWIIHKLYVWIIYKLSVWIIHKLSVSWMVVDLDHCLLKNYLIFLYLLIFNLIFKKFQMFSEIVGPLLYKPQHMKNVVNIMTIVVPVSNMPNSVSTFIGQKYFCTIKVFPYIFYIKQLIFKISHF